MSSTPSFTKLNNTNYPSWSGNMKAWLMATELWGYVDGKTPKPSDDGPELATV